MDLELLELAKNGSSDFSKFRLILPKGIDHISTIKKEFYAFPPLFKFNKLEEKQKQFLENKIVLKFGLSFLYSEIPYIKYQEYKKENIGEIISHSKFEILKDYFAILKLIEMEKNEETEISISSRTNIDFLKLPSSVYEIIKDDRLIKIGDAFIVFECGNLREKFPIFFNNLIFNTFDLFRNEKIKKISQRKISIGKNTDKKGIKKRKIIQKEDEVFFNKAMQLSYSNLKSLVENDYLFEEIQKNHFEYEQYKMGDDYRKTLDEN